MTLVTIVPWPSESMSEAARPVITSCVPAIWPVSSLIDVSTLVSITATMMPCPVAPREYAVDAPICPSPERFPLVKDEPKYSGVS